MGADIIDWIFPDRSCASCNRPGWVFYQQSNRTWLCPTCNDVAINIPRLPKVVAPEMLCNNPDCSYCEFFEDCAK